MRTGHAHGLDTAPFRERRSGLRATIGAANVPKSVISWRALQSKLVKIKRLQIFDSTEAPALNYAGKLRPGQVSILDLSDTDSPPL